MTQTTKNKKLICAFAITILIYVIYCIAFNIWSASKKHTVVYVKAKSKQIKWKDWTDYKLLEEEKLRSGLGEFGDEVFLEDPKEIRRNEKLYEETGFSVLVSDKISVNRSLPDIVHADCRNIKYLSNLPSVSVIVIFNNEVKSVLLRTIHSIINRTPSELLHEIIMVNDNSTNEELYEPLQNYVKLNFPPKVKIKNLTERKGLIVTRLEGAREASGDVLVFFDSHIEVHPNWLPPLLEPIALNSRIATMPIADYFNARTFGYSPSQKSFQGARGVIDWYLDYHELKKSPYYEANPLKPFPNPIMLGCAFAIGRKFFLEELGGYDEEFQIWNGENYELSFKLWLCADGLFTIPCSRVAHSFRSINPSRKRTEDYVARNFKRLSEVWLDEFKVLPYALEPERYAKVDMGNISKQIELRERLNCKPFRYFLTDIAPDMVERFPPFITPPLFASGAIQNVGNPRLCLDNMGQLEGRHVGLIECSDDLVNPKRNQIFIYSFFKDIRQDHGRQEYCLDAWNLGLIDCNHLPFGNQFWKYDLKSQRLVVNQKCLTAILGNETVALSDCTKEMNQRWNFGYVNLTAFEKFDGIFGYKSVITHLWQRP